MVFTIYYAKRHVAIDARQNYPPCFKHTNHCSGFFVVCLFGFNQGLAPLVIQNVVLPQTHDNAPASASSSLPPRQPYFLILKSDVVGVNFMPPSCTTAFALLLSQYFHHRGCFNLLPPRAAFCLGIVFTLHRSGAAPPALL